MTSLKTTVNTMLAAAAVGCLLLPGISTGVLQVSVAVLAAVHFGNIGVFGFRWLRTNTINAVAKSTVTSIGPCPYQDTEQETTTEPLLTRGAHIHIKSLGLTLTGLKDVINEYASHDSLLRYNECRMTTAQFLDSIDPTITDGVLERFEPDRILELARSALIVHRIQQATSRETQQQL